jgi:hypothetical protein
MFDRNFDLAYNVNEYLKSGNNYYLNFIKEIIKRAPDKNHRYIAETINKEINKQLDPIINQTIWRVAIAVVFGQALKLNANLDPTLASSSVIDLAIAACGLMLGILSVNYSNSNLFDRKNVLENLVSTLNVTPEIVAEQSMAMRA